MHSLSEPQVTCGVAKTAHIDGHPIVSTLFLFLWLAVMPRALMGQEFCALTLSVADSHGAPFTSTWIELVDANGKVVLRKMMERPIEKICDFGFGEYSVRVGVNDCFPVTLSNIRLQLGAPLFLSVIL